MEDKKNVHIEVRRLSSDSNYFNNVFKKTEKVLSVMLYILSETADSKKTSGHVERIKDKAFTTQESVLSTLSLQPHSVSHGLHEFQTNLVGFESSVRMAQMSGVITNDIALMILDQTDSVHRFIQNHYTQKSPVSYAELTETVVEKESTARKGGRPQTAATPSPVRRQSRVNIPQGDISTDAYLVYSQLTDRAERIKTVLEAKPQATVKDIAEVITDVSEKTIQRELNSLIEKGQVVREGERRWSKYSVKKD